MITCLTSLSRTLTRLAIALLISVLAISAVQAEDRYVEGFEDMPLMAELVGVPDANLAFDTKGGRIIVAFAEGPAKEQAVRKFYAKVLPQFGWIRREAGVYDREGETLHIEFPENIDAEHILVRFTLSPGAK